jgi:heme oxygenase
MIGKQMAALLLNKKTLEFYKWDGDLNEIKARVKNDIEEMVAKWSREEKDRCVGETAAAFQGGGALNSHLSGGQSPH